MTDNLNFNYMVFNNDDENQIIRVFEKPTYRKIDLNKDEAYETISIPDGMLPKHYPGLFKTQEKEEYYPSPFRKVMCSICICDLCNKNVGSDNIKQEYTDIYNRMGYFYCNDCNEYLFEILKKSGMEDIWYLRERNQDSNNRYNIWIPRTRRDENNKRINSGPFTFEKWRIVGWYATMLDDNKDKIKKPYVLCENADTNKLIPVDILKRANPENDPNYIPDPDLDWDN